MNRKNKIILGRRKPLVKNLLLLDGIGRAGKFLAANILNGFADVEPVRLCGILEHIPFFTKLGFIEKRAAEELLHHEIDMHCYETLIGRNLNHRIFDKSSVVNNPNYKKLLLRSKELDADKELNSFYKRGAYSFFLVHEVLPDMKIYFDSFPKIKVISLKRSPVDLVSSWYDTGATKRWGKDPKYFNIPAEGKNGVMPWYVFNNSEEYEKLGHMDKTILSIEALFRRYENAEKSLSSEEQEKVLFASYEDILGQTAKVVEMIRTFIGKQPLPEMARILKREALPNRDYFNGAVKKKKLDKIKFNASPHFFKRLSALEEKYYSNA